MKQKYGLLTGFAVIALAAIVTFAGCSTDASEDDKPGGDLLTLGGTVKIQKGGADVTSADINEELTAFYTGTETGLTYQWKKDGTNVSTGATTYTPTAAGSYTVTVSKTGYDSKTSNTVNVTAGSGGPPGPSNLSGTITIQQGGVDVTAANTGETLAAHYSESTIGITHQWKKDGQVIEGATSDTYLLTTTGSYTVTISKAGFNPKTSDAVTVSQGLYFKKSTHDFMGFLTLSTIIPVTKNSKDMLLALGSENKLRYDNSTGGTSFVGNSGADHFASPKAAVQLPNGDIYAVGGGGKVRSLANATPFTHAAPWADVTVTSAFNNFTAINAIIYDGPDSGKKLIIAGAYGNIAYSTDGSGWAAPSGNALSHASLFGSSSAVAIQGIAYGANTFVVVSADSKIAYSTGSDITNPGWTLATSPFGSTEIRAVIYGGDKFVAVGYVGKIAYSTDGINWMAIQSSQSGFGNSNVMGIAYGGPEGHEKFVAVGDYGKIGYSTDGITWKQATFAQTPTLGFKAVTYQEGSYTASETQVSFKRFVVVGQGLVGDGIIRYADVE